jgi:acetyl-CoA acetyltransferase
MIQTAENVAARHQLSTEQQHELVLRREEQYQAALTDERAFQKRYMTLPFDVPSPNYRKTVATMDGDEGVTRSTPEGLAKLRPVLEGGSVTYGAQTYPADGNAAMIFATPEIAAELSADPKIAVRILGFGLARAELAYMPEAPVPAAQKALQQAGTTIQQVDAVKTHNPFVANDLVFAKATGTDVMKMNNYGCSLVWGHPNAPTGLRSSIELIEELVVRGGGVGLFTGCAAGDTAMAVLLEVGDR